MEFAWLPEKEQDNIVKHGINFTDASQIFRDPRRIERHDDDSSIDEERWQTMGIAGKVLFVVYTERGEYTWIILARFAEPFDYGGFIKNIVRYTLEDGKELTPEEYAAMAARLEAASRRPYVYDPDCPLMTPEQLAEFRPVNFATMEEISQAMREAGIFDPEEVRQDAVL